MAEPARPLPDHVTTPLLTLVTQQAIEQDYLEVAQRRALGQVPPEPPRNRLVAVGVLAAFGILVSVAAVQTSRNEAVEDAGRATLISRIQQEREALQTRQEQVADLTRQNQQLADALAERTTRRQQAETQLRRLQLVTGFGVPVRGEGVRITIRGNPSGDPRRQVTDADLAMLVNGLFEAGAEAIAINDQRLNALGSIRNTGPAVHVNTRPLTAPYVVRAIGDRRTLQGRLLDTTHGAEFFSLADQLGFEYTMENEEELSLPAARQRALHHVTQAGSEDTPPGIEEGQQ